MYKCSKCKRESEGILRRVGPHIGLYCSFCGTFIKWVSADEVDPDDIIEDPPSVPLF